MDTSVGRSADNEVHGRNNLPDATEPGCGNVDSRPKRGIKPSRRTQASNAEAALNPNASKRYLDLFSTSATQERLCFLNCINNAPLFAYKKEGRTYGIVQGCCNDWTCPRCGIQRAKEEYGRIIEGCRKLSDKDDLWFITVTCRGREMSLEEAENNYGKWTHKLLESWRQAAKRANQTWAYVQVTERQKRGHPHSHILTTFCPADIQEGTKEKWTTDNQGRRTLEIVPSLRSVYIADRVVRCGLGNEYDISKARTVEGVARYVAKYLFKDSIFNTVWPKGWKRVRYSQSFPKLPSVKTDAFAVITADDWRKLARVAVFLETKSGAVTGMCKENLRGSDVVIVTRPM